MSNNWNKLSCSRHNGQKQQKVFANEDIVSKWICKINFGPFFISIYKEQILPAVNNCRASPNFVKLIEENNINYTQNSNKTQAQMVTAFSSSVYKSIVIYVLDKDDKRVAIYWTAKSLNQKLAKLALFVTNFNQIEILTLTSLLITR